MTRTAVYTDERTFWHAEPRISALLLPVGGWVQPSNGVVGVDTPDSKRRILNLMAVSGLLDRLERGRATPVTDEDLLRIHPQSYLDRFKAMSDAGGGELGPAAGFGPGGYEIAQVSAGLARSAVLDVVSGAVDAAYALCRPCGHHCLPDQPMGASLFANIALAIEAAIAAFGPRRVAVVDWDVHHGNGTQAIFYDRADVLTVSLHQDGCFPFGYGGRDDRGAGAGLGLNINVPLPPGSGHEAYLHAIRSIVTPALDRFRPELIVVASGLDAGAFDPMGRMMLHSDSYRAMTAEMAAAAARHCDGRLVVVQEGGYSESYAPFCGLAVVEALSGERTEVVDPLLDMLQAQQPSGAALAFQLALVDEMAAAFASPPPPATA